MKPKGDGPTHEAMRQASAGKFNNNLTDKRKDNTLPAMKLTNGARLLKSEEVARILRVHPRSITRWCEQGEFVGAIKVGRHWRIPANKILSRTGSLAP
jgi:excisionase family DNA binding protein